MSYSVLGLGQPLIDIIIQVNDEFLNKYQIEKGGSQQVNFEELQNLLHLAEQEFSFIHQQEHLEERMDSSIISNTSDNFHLSHYLKAFKKNSKQNDFKLEENNENNESTSTSNPTSPSTSNISDNNSALCSILSNFGAIMAKKSSQIIICCGGSCCNTIKGISMLGETASFMGKVGHREDPLAKLYKDSIAQKGVIPLMTESITDKNTGVVLCLVTPEGQRTMRAHLGASLEMTESDLIEDDFDNTKLLYVEGYSFYNKPLTVKAMQIAKSKGVKVAYDVGCFEIVRKFKKPLIELLRNYVDIVFCNEEEAWELCHDAPENAVDFLASIVDVAVVMVGSKGVWCKSKNEKIFFSTEAVTAVDTTGAGDLFSSGFVYGYLQGYDLSTCLRIGCLCGKTVVGNFGAEIYESQYKEIKKTIHSVTSVPVPVVNSSSGHYHQKNCF